MVKERLCRCFSSSAGLVFAGCVVVGMLQPFEWWQNLIGTAIFAPLAVLATSRFYGVDKLWDWKCSGCSREKRKKKQ